MSEKEPHHSYGSYDSSNTSDYPQGHGLKSRFNRKGWRGTLSSGVPLIIYPFRVAVFFLVVLWVSFFLSQLPLPIVGDFLHLGIIPRNPVGLIGIFTAPWVHADFNHILSNQPLLLHLVFLSILKPGREAIIIFLLVVSTGLGVWIFGMAGNHIGASGLIFALQGFNLLSAIYQRRWIILGGLLLFLLAENSLLYGLFGWFTFDIDSTSISYSSHISGFLFGILWAGIFRPRQQLNGQSSTGL